MGSATTEYGAGLAARLSRVDAHLPDEMHLPPYRGACTALLAAVVRSTCDPVRQDCTRGGLRRMRLAWGRQSECRLAWGRRRRSESPLREAISAERDFSQGSICCGSGLKC